VRLWDATPFVTALPELIARAEALCRLPDSNRHALAGAGY
jgi:hypothetical protein